MSQVKRALIELRRSQLVVESAGLALVLGLFFFIFVPMLSSSVMYLGGDTAREAWRAGELIRTGHFSHRYGGPYDSDYFALILVPFIWLFGRTILCLQLVTICLGLATVVAFYSFLRRAFGLLAAVVLSCVLASSPLFLSHAAAGPLFNAPLMIALIMVLSTWQHPSAVLVAAAVAGLFTSLNGFFLVPLLTLLACTVELPRTMASRWPRWRRAATCYAAGAGMIVFKFLAADPEQPTFVAWFRTFLHSNGERWHHPLLLMSSVWVHWCAGLTTFKSYRPVSGPADISWVVIVWGLMLVMALVGEGKGRRYSVGLIFGGLLIGFLQSTNGGLGMRHILVLLPFQWLFVAPILARRKAEPPKIAVLGVLIALVATQVAAARRLAARSEPISAGIIENTEHVARFLEDRPGIHTTVQADNPNAYLSLLYLAPDGNITQDVRPASPDRTGTILCSTEHSATSTAAHGPTRTLAQGLLLSGRTNYDLIWEPAAASARARSLAKLTRSGRSRF